jgi:hypothetical protein
MHELAAAAATEDRARRNNSVFCGSEKLNCFAHELAAAGVSQPRSDTFARDGKGHKNRSTLVSADAFALGRESIDGKLKAA